jgi:hypothetical protein
MYSRIRVGLATLALIAIVGACGGTAPQSTGPTGLENCAPVSITGPDGAQVDLSGVWSGNDGGIYYMKQIDDCLWWSGLSNFQGQYPGEAWVMAFKGRMGADKVIHGEFVDVKSDNPGSGTMTIAIDPQTVDGAAVVYLNRTESTGHEIGVTFWQRMGNEPTPAPTDQPTQPPASGQPSPTSSATTGTTPKPTATATQTASPTASAVPTDASGNPVTLPPG